jgi:hypothetical protein
LLFCPAEFVSLTILSVFRFSLIQLCTLGIVLVVLMDDQLNPCTHVDPTSRLLQPEKPQTIAHQNNDTRAAGVNHQSEHTHSDQIDVRAPYENDKAANGEQYTSSTAVLWKGLPRYLLTWELLSITLSLCFLGMITVLLCNATPLTTRQLWVRPLPHSRVSPKAHGRLG